MRISSKHITATIKSGADNSCEAIFTLFNRDGRIFIGYASLKKKRRERKGRELKMRVNEWRADRRSLCESHRSSLTNPWAVKQWM